MWTKFKRWKKFKEDEIKNNFQIEIIYTNKKIVTKKIWAKSEGKANWRVIVKFFRGNAQFKEGEREKKKFNQCQTVEYYNTCTTQRGRHCWDQ
jgi:hypothetical protein